MTKHILIVDDDAGVRTEVGDMRENLRYRVSMVADGADMRRFLAMDEALLLPQPASSGTSQVWWVEKFIEGRLWLRDSFRADRTSALQWYLGKSYMPGPVTGLSLR
jgi:hypothetical protein